MSAKKRTPASLRMDERLSAKVEAAMEATGLSQAEILRMALAVGLEDMRRIDYDLASAIVNQAKAMPYLKTAEDPVPYEVKKNGTDGVN
jgi:predicted DNA-binding protein